MGCAIKLPITILKKECIIVKLVKTTAIVLLLSLMLGSFSACGKSDNAGAQSSGTDNTSNTDTETAGESNASGDVKMLVNVTGGKDEEEMELFAKALSEATGLNVTMEKPPSDYDAVMLQKLQSGEKYDLIQANAPKYLDMVTQGALMDITDKVKASDILTNNIDQKEWDDITIDGKIYGGFNKRELQSLVALNKTHLEEAGIDYKTIEPTLDGYYEVMKKLKEAKSDEADYYPFGTIFAETWNIQPWMAAVGLKNGVVIDEDGKRYSPYSTEEAGEVWEWFKKLYDEGLVDPASFVDQTKDMREKMGAASQKLSICVDWSLWVGIHNANAEAGGIAETDYDIVSLPGIKTPDGSHMLVKGGANVYMVPNNAQNVDGAIKILEYFATQEGGDLLSIGIPDHDYTVVDGKVELTEIGSTHAKDHGAPIPIFKDWEAKAGLNRGVEEAIGYLDYATIDLIIPNEKEWKEITGKWAIKIIRGEEDTESALKAMREELIALEVIDK